MKLVPRTPKNPIRLQIALSGQLVAEVIVENMTEADKIWARWSVGRYKRNEPQGSACMNSIYMDRLWDVPVGSLIQLINFHQSSE